MSSGVGRRLRPAVAVVSILAFVALTGCGADSGPDGQTVSDAASAMPGPSSGVGSSGAAGASGSDGAHPVVTVPALDGGGANGSGVAAPGASSWAELPGSGTRTVTETVPPNPEASGSGQNDPNASPEPTRGTPATAAPGTKTTPTPATVPHTKTIATTAQQPKSGTVAGVKVSPSVCTGCTAVIAAAPSVTGNFSAALMATGRTPALISLRPDGSLAGIIAVLYGATFPTPPGQRLPCDSAGRCVVTGKQADGTAMLSAFELTSDGAWRDLMTATGSGLHSATARSGVVDVGGGELGLAIQVTGDGQTGWMVFAWSGDRYTPMGCAADSTNPPTKAQLSFDACLS